MTRGLAEMTRLGAKMGANPRTFSGLSGLGDLILTCTGDLSRNRSLGVRLGKGESLQDIVQGTTSIIEGIATTKAAHQLSQRLRVEMPITHQTHLVLYENKSPKVAVSELMSRDLRYELDSPL